MDRAQGNLDNWNTGLTDKLKTNPKLFGNFLLFRNWDIQQAVCAECLRQLQTSLINKYINQGIAHQENKDTIHYS